MRRALRTAIEDFQRGFAVWSEVPAVVVGAVQGHAIGAGFQLALACDLRVVADDVSFAMRETSLGLVPDLAGTAPLVRLVGYARALEICATGRAVRADEAVRLRTGPCRRAAGGARRHRARPGRGDPPGAGGGGARAEAAAAGRRRRGTGDQRRAEREAQARLLHGLRVPARPSSPLEVTATGSVLSDAGITR